MCSQQEWESLRRRFEDALDDAQLRELAADAIASIEAFVEEVAVNVAAFVAEMLAANVARGRFRAKQGSRRPGRDAPDEGRAGVGGRGVRRRTPGGAPTAPQQLVSAKSGRPG